jgi:hypothetical protein
MWPVQHVCSIKQNVDQQWGGRLLSLQSKVWDQNFGGLWQYDFNGFIMQYVSFSCEMVVSDRQNRMHRCGTDFLFRCELCHTWKVS